jgi:hypothetical protein
MVEAMSEARKSVFKENDCAVSSASSRFTDLSSRMPEFHLPAHAVEVGDLPRPDPRWKIGQEGAIPFRGLDPHQTQQQRVGPPAHMHIGVNDPAVEAQRLLLEQRIEVGSRAELLCDLPARDVIHLRLPVLFEADDEPNAVDVAGPEARQTGIGQVGQQAIRASSPVMALPSALFPHVL